MNRDEYHANTKAVSKSMICDFLDRRQVYYRKYVLGEFPPRATSAAMDLGTVCHAALLEPHKLGDLVVVMPADVLASNGAESTKAAKEFRATNESAGKIVLKESQLETVRRMVDSVLASPVGIWLRQDAVIETPRYWLDEVSGLRCRCLPDWHCPRTGIMLDIKTTKMIDPASFARQSNDLRYWLQASHYLDSIGGEGHMLFVAVESEWPYETVVYEYPASDGGDSIDLEFADGVRHRALQDIAECHATGNWSDSWSGCVNPIVKRYSKGKA